MARRPNQVSIPNPEFGVDFDASARAMHQSASKGSLMVHETAFSVPAVARKSLAATMFERNTMLKTLKRKIALVAVAALGAGGLSIVAAPVANAAATSTSAVSAVRVSFTGASTTPDVVRLVPIVITHRDDFVRAGSTTDEATVTLTTAPTAAAVLEVATAAADAAVGTADPGNATSGRRVLSLANPTRAFLGNGAQAVTAATKTSTLWVAVSTPGTYAGSISINGNGAAGATTDDSVATFSFTTTGAPASFALDSTSQSVPAGGSSDWTLTVKDANGNVTNVGSLDKFTVTCSATLCGTNLLKDADGNALNGEISAAEVAENNGVVPFTHFTGNAAGTTTTISVKAVATISALGTVTATVTETSQVINATPLLATPTVTTTPAAGTITATSPGTGRIKAVAVKTGTSEVSFGITAPAGHLGKEFRFKLVADAGTIDGTAYTTPVYKNVVTNATTGAGSFSFKLGGAALLTNAKVTVYQVDVVGTLVGYVDNNTGNANNGPTAADGRVMIITQTDASFAETGITPDPKGGVVAKLGTSVPIKVALTNSYSEPLGAGYTVSVYRTSTSGTLLDSKVTGADGTATVNVTNLSTLTTAGSETYVYRVLPPVGSAVTATTNTTTVNWTTTGTVSSISVAITNNTGTGGNATTPITTATLASSITRIPVVYLPVDGSVSTPSDIARILATTTTAAADSDTATGARIGWNTAGEYFTLVGSPTYATPITWTGTDGVKFCSSATLTALSTTASTCKWDTGTSTVTASSANNIHVYALKTGTHTVTATVGEVKTTLQFIARNRPTDGYNISITPATQNLDSGAYGKVNVKTTDIFGNAVAVPANDITVTVTGPALLSGLSNSSSPATSATAGAEGVDLIIIASSTGSGDATVSVAPGAATAATAWGSTYVAPTGAPAAIKAASATVTVKAAAASAAQTAETTAIKNDVKAVSDTVATLSKAVTTVQSSVTELTTSFTSQIKSLTSAIAKISRAIAAIQKSLKARR